MWTSMIVKKCSLPDSEFVLFVDHDESQIRKPYVILKNSLCPDEDLDMSGFHLFFDMCFLFVCSASLEEFYSDPEW